MAKQDVINYLKQFPGSENTPEGQEALKAVDATVADLAPAPVAPEQKQSAFDTISSDIGQLASDAGTNALGFGAGLVKGASKDFAGEVYGAGKSMLGLGTYEEGKKEADTAINSAIEAAPKSGFIGEVAGDIGTDVALGAATAGVGTAVGKAGRIGQLASRLLSPATSTAGKIGQAAALGATSGSLKGAGQGEGLEDTLSKAGEGALVGGVVGGVAGAVGVGLSAAKAARAKNIGLTEDIIENLGNDNYGRTIEVLNKPTTEAISETAQTALPYTKVGPSPVQGNLRSPKIQELKNIQDEARASVVGVSSKVLGQKAESLGKSIDRATIEPSLSKLDELIALSEGPEKATLSKIKSLLGNGDSISTSALNQAVDGLASKELSGGVKGSARAVAADLKEALKETFGKGYKETTEATKGVLGSKFSKTTEKGTVKEFYNAIKKNPDAAQQAINELSGVLGKSSQDVTKAIERGDFLKALPTDAKKMEDFIAKGIQYGQDTAAKKSSKAFDTQAEIDVFNAMNATVPNFKQALLDMRTAIASDPKRASELISRNVNSGMSAIAQGSGKGFFMSLFRGMMNLGDASIVNTFIPKSNTSRLLQAASRLPVSGTNVVRGSNGQ